ncbi:MAG: bifunctional oligoribonuclease/PAP phosphatase NrnA [Bacteroidia bacterium]|nr:bifunctional oligoribonuclease/PAP phosphatase NrnA [Bacteroidia bacterium]
MEQIEALKSLLSRPRRIAITTHHKPDGDAIGSSLGLYHYLLKGGHKVTIVSPTEYADFLKWIPGNDKVLIGPNDPDLARWTFDGADIIFCLDFNGLSRINEFEPMVRDSYAQKVMIDHHPDPEGFENIAFLDTAASSTAELVYRIMVAMGDADKLDLPIAEALYTGVMTDTGSFRYTNTSAEVHRMVAHFIETGINVNRIHDLIFANFSAERYKFLGYCLLNCLYVLPEYKTAYIKLEKEIFRQFNVKAGDTEGLVNYAMSIKDVNLAVLITTQDDLVKMSFRSRGEVSASEFAKNFEGGGHFYAAGGKSKDSLEDTEKRFLQLLEEKKQILA